MNSSVREEDVAGPRGRLHGDRPERQAAGERRGGREPAPGPLAPDAVHEADRHQERRVDGARDRRHGRAHARRRDPGPLPAPRRPAPARPASASLLSALRPAPRTASARPPLPAQVAERHEQSGGEQHGACRHHAAGVEAVEQFEARRRRDEARARDRQAGEGHERPVAGVRGHRFSASSSDRNNSARRAPAASGTSGPAGNRPGRRIPEPDPRRPRDAPPACAAAT